VCYLPVDSFMRRVLMTSTGDVAMAITIPAQILLKK
jgi:hypothetical protein